MTFWWLGQMGLAVKTVGKLLFFDLFLSPHEGRFATPPFSGRDVKGADLVFGSHDHLDHIDTEVWADIAAGDPGALFAAPDLVLPALAERGLPNRRLRGINDGESVTLAGVTITGVAAAHEGLDKDPASGRYPYMGFLVEVDGFTIYHAGDTCVYDGLTAKLRGKNIDLCLLPINGRDAERLGRDCIGNMTWQEAADLAGALAPALALPGHYDMMAGNTADPGLFLHYMRVKYPGVRVAAPRYCEAVTLGR